MIQPNDIHTLQFTNIILPQTNLWLGPKLKSNIKYFLIHSLSLIFTSSHQSDSFIYNKKETLAVNHTKPIVHRHRLPLRSFISWLILSCLCHWFILIIFHCFPCSFYMSSIYTRFYEIFCENMIFLIVFLNKPINRTKPISLVRFFFKQWKPNQSKPMKVSSIRPVFDWKPI